MSQNTPTYGVQLIGGTLSGVSYVLVIALTISCVKAVIRSRFLSTTQRMNHLIYMSFLVFLTTMVVLMEAANASGKVALHISPLVRLSLAIASSMCALPLAVWGPDAKMVVNYIFYFEGKTKFRQFALLGLITLLTIASIGSQIIYVVWSFNVSNNGTLVTIDTLKNRKLAVLGPTYAFIFTLFTVTDLLIISLIAARLVWYQNRNRRTLGEISAPFTRFILSVCIESCALVIIGDIATLVLLFTVDQNDFVLGGFVTHTSILSTIILIHRLAIGTDAITTLKSIAQESSRSESADSTLNPEAIILVREEAAGGSNSGSAEETVKLLPASSCQDSDLKVDHLVDVEGASEKDIEAAMSK